MLLACSIALALLWPIQKPLPADLINAVRSNDATVVARLLSRGANPSSRETLQTKPSVSERIAGGTPYPGDTALIIAIENRSEAIAKLLIDKGADVNGKGLSGFTPLISAAQNLAITKLLLEKGAKVDLPNDYGDTALVFAANTGQNEIVTLLVRHGAKLNGGTGWTPLMQASYNGYEDTVRLLIKLGANPNFYRSPYMSPLECAKAQGNNEIAGILRKAGAKTDPAAAKQRERARTALLAEMDRRAKQLAKELEATESEKAKEVKPEDGLVFEAMLNYLLTHKGDESGFFGEKPKFYLIAKSCRVTESTESQMNHRLSTAQANDLTLEMRKQWIKRNVAERSLKSLVFTNPAIELLEDSYSFLDPLARSARGWIRPSLPGYSSDGSKAFIRGSIGPSAHGGAVTIYLEKSDGVWRVKWTEFSYYA